MSEQEQMTMKELAYWLESTDEKAVHWRTALENQVQVSNMINEYGSRPGGKAPYVVSGSIRLERERRQALELQEVQVQARQEKLKEIMKQRFVGAGGSPFEFETKWPQMRQDLVTSGESEAILHRHVNERRARAARTF